MDDNLPLEFFRTIPFTVVADEPPPTSTNQIVASITKTHNGATLIAGQPIVCPTCKRDDNWELGGHSRGPVWECDHGPVEFMPTLRNVFTIPTRYT
jgi:hypothetical protein